MIRHYLFVVISLLILINLIACHNDSHSKTMANHNSKNISNEKRNSRIKRALHPETEKVFMPLNPKLIDFDLEHKDQEINYDLEQPFWGTRGRRDSSEENVNDIYDTDTHLYGVSSENCKNCFKALLNNYDSSEAISPFWGNRGRRNSKEIEDYSTNYNPFWANRGKRQEDEPFWGTRGRREQELPFWGSRGRREGIFVKGEKYINDNSLNNRFKSDTTRGGRGSQSAQAYLLKQALRDDIEPFWGNRGRRETVDPFWGSRGKKKGYKEAYEQYGPFWESKGRRKAEQAHSIVSAMNRMQHDIENLSRLRRNKVVTPYFSNIEQENELPGFLANRGSGHMKKDSTADFRLDFKPSEPETVLDDRIYAEQPRFILVERSSRSSAEDDPFFISRGKKFMNKSLKQAIRGRRGALEELVKSVRNDPYYIARGKKNAENLKIGNATISNEVLEKAVDLICSIVDLLDIKEDEVKVKRGKNDNERDRRTTLKNLAAQLQIDPYFVSRGKKREFSGIQGDNFNAFIYQVAAMCDYKNIVI